MRAKGVLIGSCALAALAACGELVGLGNAVTVSSDDGGTDAREDDASPDGAETSPPPSLAACGISVATSTCQSCMTAHCCEASDACANDDSCAEYENCLVPCANDYACRARCLIDHAGKQYVAPEIAPLNQCVATSCANECGLTCGIADSFAEPDSAPACAACLGSNSCAKWVACGADVDCETVALCAATCVTQDCQLACGDGLDAGAQLYLTALGNATSCVPTCNIGSYWECVNDVPPELVRGAGETSLTLGIAGAGAGVTVTACPSLADQTCTPSLATTKTDENGNAQFEFDVVNPPALGFYGYFEISGPGLAPELLFLEFPLSEAQSNLLAWTLTTDTLQGYYTRESVEPSANTRATVWVEATDCHWIFAPGVTVEATGIDAETKETYNTHGATATDISGFAFFLDAPAPQDITVGVTSPTAGRVATGLTVFTRPGWVSFIVVHPNMGAPGGPVDTPQLR
jgi:hypothetical protein